MYLAQVIPNFNNSERAHNRPFWVFSFDLATYGSITVVYRKGIFINKLLNFIYKKYHDQKTNSGT